MQSEPEQACHVLGEALTLMLLGGNAMGVERIRGVHAGIPEEWTRMACVRELNERLRLG